MEPATSLENIRIVSTDGFFEIWKIGKEADLVNGVYRGESKSDAGIEAEFEANPIQFIWDNRFHSLAFPEAWRECPVVVELGLDALLDRRLADIEHAGAESDARWEAKRRANESKALEDARDTAQRLIDGEFVAHHHVAAAFRAFSIKLPVWAWRHLYKFDLARKGNYNRRSKAGRAVCDALDALSANA